MKTTQKTIVIMSSPTKHTISPTILSELIVKSTILHEITMKPDTTIAEYIRIEILIDISLLMSLNELIRSVPMAAHPIKRRITVAVADLVEIDILDYLLLVFKVII